MATEIKAKGQKELKSYEPGEMLTNSVPYYELPAKMWNCLVEVIYAKEQRPNDAELGEKVRKIIDKYQFTT